MSAVNLMNRSMLCAAFALTWSVSAQASPYTFGNRLQPLTADTSLQGYALATGTGGSALMATLSGQAIPLIDGPTPQFGSPITSSTSGDLFGSAVAIAKPTQQDSFIAIGAFGDDTPAMNAGRVDLYRVGSSFTEAPTAAGTVRSPNPVATGNFGYAVALSGNFAIVGEVKAFSSITQSEAGAVHVFENTGASTWVLRSSVPSPATLARFGHSLAIDGNTLVVGAPNEGSGVLDKTGAAYVYTLNSGGTLSFVQRLDGGTEQEANDEFGTSVAVLGNTLAVGAPRDNKAAGTDGGTALIFARSASTWTQEAKVRSSVPAALNLFGWSVSLAPNELAVGAYCESGGACIGGGALEVFTRQNGNWTQTQRTRAADVLDGEAFGSAVAHSSTGLLIGAVRAGPNFRGALYRGVSDRVFANGFE
jgi:hypothetical protein